jgi:hypothetical protein
LIGGANCWHLISLPAALISLLHEWLVECNREVATKLHDLCSMLHAPCSVLHDIMMSHYTLPNYKVFIMRRVEHWEWSIDLYSESETAVVTTLGWEAQLFARALVCIAWLLYLDITYSCPRTDVVSSDMSKVVKFLIRKHGTELSQFSY